MHQDAIDALAQAIRRDRRALADLKAAFYDAMQQQEIAVIKAFDDGAKRNEICEAFGVTYTRAAYILAHAKPPRSEQQRRGLKLKPKARQHYEKLLRAKVPSSIAAQIAEAIVEMAS